MGSIVVFCKTFVKGGAEKQALILARLLNREGFKVMVISWSSHRIDPRHQEFIRDNALPYVALKGNPVSRFIEFNRILRDKKVSVVFAYLTLANVVSGLSTLFNKRLVSIGGVRTEKLPFLKLLAERFVHNNLNSATVFNNYSARFKFEKRGFNPDKIIVIHNAIKSSPRVKTARGGETINIITVARFVRAKDFRTSLLGIKELIIRNPEISLRYLLVGYGPLESHIRSMINSLDLEEQVEVIINPPNVNEYYKDADIYLSTSLFEGLSNSLMEAMVAGLPIVATDVGDNNYLVKEGLNGYLVPLNDFDAIVMSLEKLVRSKAERESFGVSSNNLIIAGFSEEKLVARYIDVIEKYAASTEGKVNIEK